MSLKIFWQVCPVGKKWWLIAFIWELSSTVSHHTRNGCHSAVEYSHTAQHPVCCVCVCVRTCVDMLACTFVCCVQVCVRVRVVCTCMYVALQHVLLYTSSELAVVALLPALSSAAQPRPPVPPWCHQCDLHLPQWGPAQRTQVLGPAACLSLTEVH